MPDTTTQPTQSEPAAPAAGDRAALGALLLPIREAMDGVQAALDEITASHAPYVQRLVEHVRAFGGKRLRPALVILSGRAVGREAVGDVHARVGAVVELIHTATLVHDDILDGALVRRGRSTLHRLEGVEVSVLLGDFLLASAYAEAASLEDRLASRYLAQITRQVCQGEVLQIHNRGNLDLGLEEYFEIIEKKTAVLYQAACQVGARYAGGDEATVAALATYGLELGMAFQIVDDVLDLTGDEEIVGKSLGTDLARGKPTLPLIHFLRYGPAADVAFVREEIGAGRGAQSAVPIRERVIAAGSIEHARQEAGRRLDQAVAALEALPASDEREILTAIAGYVLSRRR